MDATPVTNAQFLAFVSAHPEWRRDRIAPVFAEATYLASLGVSGRARRERRAGRAGRERELVRGARLLHDARHAPADGGRVGARGGRELRPRRRRDRPRVAHATRRDVRSTEPRAPAARRLVAREFLGPLRSPRRRLGVGLGLQRGGERVLERRRSASILRRGRRERHDATDFAAFERVAFRSSLRANYTVRNLGFRCVGSP